MLKLKDFECERCGVVFEELTSGDELRCSCGGFCRVVYTKAPAVSGCDSFNPHFDDQVGQFFESAEHKRKVLKSLGKVQVSGQLSPRKSNKTSIKMSLSQAHKFDLSYKARMPKGDNK